MPLLSDAKTCYVGNTPITTIMAGSVKVWPKAVDSFENIRCLGYEGSNGGVGGVMIVWNDNDFLTCEETRRRLWVRTQANAAASWIDWILCIYAPYNGQVKISKNDPTLKFGAEGFRTDTDAVPRYWQWKYVFDDGQESVSPEMLLNYSVPNQSKILPSQKDWDRCTG